MSASWYVERPLEVEAMQFTGSNWNEVSAFMGSRSGGGVWSARGKSLKIWRQSGVPLTANPGDYIVKEPLSPRDSRFKVYLPSSFTVLYRPCQPFAEKDVG